MVHPYIDFENEKFNLHSSPRPRQKKQPKEEDEVFHAKPVKHKRSPEKSKETDYDKGFLYNRHF